MYKIFFTISVLIGTVIGFTSLKVANENKALEIGSEVPLSDEKMANIDGKAYSLNDLKKENGLLVVFSCNTCPFVIGNGDKEGWEGRYNDLYESALKNQMGMVLVNSNEAKRKGEDSMKNMKAHAKEQGYKMAYVIDKNHKLADAVGARTTPHVYLLDKDLKLVYRGLIDDNVNSAKEVKVKYLEGAMKEVANGRSPEPATTKAMGCSIKRAG
ncbi:MAG: redoxin family protein [Salibacteraceae bacterium]